MTDRALAAAALLLGLATACRSAPSDAATSGGGSGRSGDERLAAGDFDGAAREFQRQIDAGGESAALREKLLNAKFRAAAAHAMAATAAADAGDVDRARSELARA